MILQCKPPLARSRQPRSGICPLLLFIGLPRELVYAPDNPRLPVGSFWERNAGQLDFILRDAELAFRRAIKIAHPDARGSDRHAADLNLARERIHHLFELHGATL